MWEGLSTSRSCATSGSCCWLCWCAIYIFHLATCRGLTRARAGPTSLPPDLGELVVRCNTFCMLLSPSMEVLATPNWCNFMSRWCWQIQGRGAPRACCSVRSNLWPAIDGGFQFSLWTKFEHYFLGGWTFWPEIWQHFCSFSKVKDSRFDIQYPWWKFWSPLQSSVVEETSQISPNSRVYCSWITGVPKISCGVKLNYFCCSLVEAFWKDSLYANIKI